VDSGWSTDFSKKKTATEPEEGEAGNGSEMEMEMDRSYNRGPMFCFLIISGFRISQSPTT
jgi:hypothetical protein